MLPSGALKPTKRAKKIIAEIEYLKETYISYFIGPENRAYKEVSDILDRVEEYVIELSAGKRVLEAQLAEKIRKR